MKEIQNVFLAWTGPYSIGSAQNFLDESRDYGLYAVYGSHVVYGTDVLLYIGKAADQTFGKRFSQHLYWMDYHEDAENLKIYLARLCGPQNCTEQKWTDMINGAEKLMIHSHSPAYNSQNIKSIKNDEIRHFHVFNWGRSRSLLPEVSGLCWSDTFCEMDEEDVFTVDRCTDSN